MTTSEDDLEALADGELQRLPVLKAPHTLLPRVLAAVQAWAGRPWYQRTWLTWPIVWRLASAAALGLLLWAGAALLPHVQAMAGAVASNLPVSLTNSLGVASRSLGTVTTVAGALWQTLFGPLALCAFALVTSLGLTCGVCAAALSRVALGRMVQP